MVKLLLGLLVLLLGAGLVVLLVAQDPGYALLSYGDWSVETTLALVLGTVVAGYVGVWFVLRAARLILGLPGRLRRHRQKSHGEKARSELMKGLIELAEGRWQEAERLLLKHVSDSDTPVLNYLGAARAAQHRDDHERRDKHLREAFEAMPSAEVAIGLTQAELQLGQGQIEQALATLRRLHGLAPRHAYVAKLLAKAYHRIGDWENLLAILPRIRKARVMRDSSLRAMQRDAIRGRLADLGARGDVEALERFWRQLDREQRTDGELVMAYVEQLRRLKADAKARELLGEQLGREWDETLVAVFGELDPGDGQVALQQAEKWLKAHPASPALLLTLGRLSARKELWGKARQYLEESLELRPSAAAHAELGRLLQETGEDTEALRHYRAGLALATGQAEPPPAAGRSQTA